MNKSKKPRTGKTGMQVRKRRERERKKNKYIYELKKKSKWMTNTQIR